MTCNISVFDIYGTEEPLIPGTHTKVGFRLPEYGDTVLAFDGDVYTFKKPDFTPKGPRIILEEATPESIYGSTIPATPTGYTRGEFREVQGGETFLGQCGGEVKHWGQSAYNQGPRYILTPLSTPFTPKFKVGEKVNASGFSFGGTVISAPGSADKRYLVRWDSGVIQSSMEWEDHLSLAPPPQPTKAPEGYYFTGEYRTVRRGDFYTTNGVIVSALCGDADYKIGNTQRHILKPLPPKPTVAGWEAVKFRSVNSGDTYYSPFFMMVRTASNQDYSVPPVPYWIMRPVPTPPPPSKRWLIEVQSSTEPCSVRVLSGIMMRQSLQVVGVTPKTPKPQ